MKRNYVATIVALSLIVCMRPSSAQMGNADQAMKIAAARKKNAALMQQYTWNCRTELLENGSVKDIRIELVNYGPDGQLQRSVINNEGSHMPHGFFRRAIAENKKKETEKYLKGLRELLDQYTLPTAGKILDFMSQASTTAIQGPDGRPLVQMSGNGVVQPGDSFTIAMDPATNQTRQVTISSFFEGSVVSATATFKTNKAGLTYMAFGEVDVPDKGITVQIQNFDYESNN
jgi:hypothetical protein